MSEMTDKCAHLTCHCPAHMDSGYCCDRCEMGTGDDETGCQCGHAECQANTSTTGILLRPVKPL